MEENHWSSHEIIEGNVFMAGRIAPIQMVSVFMKKLQQESQVSVLSVTVGRKSAEVVNIRLSVKL